MRELAPPLTVGHATSSVRASFSRQSNPRADDGNKRIMTHVAPAAAAKDGRTPCPAMHASHSHLPIAFLEVQATYELLTTTQNARTQQTTRVLW
jgi:hypothetical protein